uniref:Uncharacterized protein n=2 Tax=Amorphochlora amoebiformis TaxID=1561963 RepID=A0A7S0DGV6_9EUKA|mmetsp:Transcript_25480/g.40236  ORF Transcript_25480/g.40236 Transcript_25480/m.40236 type:complete len:425 (+) Transcript_25480:25-1299(+)
MGSSVLHENSLLRAPYESVHMVTRNTQKIVAKEITYVVAEVKRLARAAKERSKGANLINATKSITSMVKKLQGLKRKMEEGEKTSTKYVNRCQARLDHLTQLHEVTKNKGGSGGSSLELTSLSKNETVLRSLDSMLAGHLLRGGGLQTALLLAKNSNVFHLVDSEVFISAKKVIDGLRNHNCKPALAWCAANRSRLRRSHSPLEADLRVQQFVEMLKKNDVEGALKYARSHLSFISTSRQKRALHAMGAIAFVPPTKSLPERYKYLFEDKNWAELEGSFRKVLFKLNGLSAKSSISIRLQIGLEALKTHHCLTGGENEEKKRRKGVKKARSERSNTASHCPVCSKGMYGLAQDLPPSHRSHSCIVCRICGEVMDENNPPMALPNGNVYSKKAIDENSKLNHGDIVDPRSDDRFAKKKAKNVYIL